jgi:hypothetical protein
MKYWEIIADNLHDAGWSLGWVKTIDRQGRTIWIVDAHGYGKRFIVRADEIMIVCRTGTGDTPIRGEFGVIKPRSSHCCS